MRRNRRFLIGGLIILGALSYIIYGGAKDAIVYFRTPSEVKASGNTFTNQFLRMGGMVVKGSLQKDAKNLTYRFELTDGTASIPVFFRGVPPDLFADGKGAVVEGRIGGDGLFHATTIMAKHSEEYTQPPESKFSYPQTVFPSKAPQRKHTN